MSSRQKTCQMSKSQTCGLWRRFTKKKKIDIMRFTHIDINFDVKYEGHQNCSKTLSMHIMRVFGDHHMWCQKLTLICVNLIMSIFFLNLLLSPCIWLFDIWHLFDNLTSFWQFDTLLETTSAGHRLGVKGYMWHVPTSCMLLNNVYI